MEQFWLIVFTVAIAVLGFVTTENYRLRKSLEDLENLVDAIRHSCNTTTSVVADIVPPEQAHQKERLNLILMESDFHR